MRSSEGQFISSVYGVSMLNSISPSSAWKYNRTVQKMIIFICVNKIQLTYCDGESEVPPCQKSNDNNAKCPPLLEHGVNSRKSASSLKNQGFWWPGYMQTNTGQNHQSRFHAAFKNAKQFRSVFSYFAKEWFYIANRNSHKTIMKT